MQVSDDVKKVKDIMQLLLKARKILRMYPANNPIYVNTLEENYKRLRDFFYYKDDLVLSVRQNEILYDAEQVYYSTEKEDNIAVFFFKDGLREITFLKGLPSEELEAFLKIISLDFNRDMLDDDLITLFWEQDFQKIRYVVDDLVLSDDEDYEERAVKQAKAEAEEPEDNLQRAYEDASREPEDVAEVSIVPLVDKDLQLLMKELEDYGLDKTPKLFDILFEMIALSESPAEVEDIVLFLKNAIEYTISRGDIPYLSQTLERLVQIVNDKDISEEVRRQMKKVVLHAGSDEIITILGQVLDSWQETEDKVFEDFARHLDRNAIVPLMKVLGELTSIHARKFVIDALVLLGKKDISVLAKGLSDTRWYVVRNIIYILRKIGDKRAVDYLLKTVKHGDVRVKKEVIRTLGELGGTGVLQALRDCLDDPDDQVRSSALKALGSIGSEAPKRIILNKLQDKAFKDREYEEKKEFYEALARWTDDEVYNFLTSTLKQTVLFGRAKSYENRASAASALGLLGRKDAVALLQKYRNDSSKLLRDAVVVAIKRLGHNG